MNGPSWKPAKDDVEGNYGQAVSAAAKLKSKRPHPVTPAPQGTNSGQKMTHPIDVDPEVPSPGTPDPTSGRRQHGSV